MRRGRAARTATRGSLAARMGTSLVIARKKPSRTRVAMLADVEDELLSLAGQLECLAPEEWGVRSLCSSWTVKEVVAHLTLSTRESLGQTIGPLIRARGDFDGLTAARARERARQFTSVELIDQVREMAGVDRASPFPDASTRWSTSSCTDRTSSAPSVDSG